MCVCVCVCVCTRACVCGYALDIFAIFLCDYPWFNMFITSIGDNNMLVYKILSVLIKS